MAPGKVRRRVLCHLPPVSILVLFFFFFLIKFVIFFDFNFCVRKVRIEIKRSLRRKQEKKKEGEG